MDISKYKSFEEMPEELKNQVFKMLLKAKRPDRLAIRISEEGKKCFHIWRNEPVQDYSDTEIYDWKVPVHAGIIEKANARGCRIIFSKMGFTENAKKLAKEYWINLETSPLFFKTDEKK